MSPAMTMINSGQTLQEMRTQMERVDDVLEYPLDENVTRHIDMDEVSKIKGNLVLKDLVFGYSRLDKPILEGFNLEIKQGQKVAIVGTTGSGKSTLSKLISGLYSPWSGEIIFNGKKMNEIAISPEALEKAYHAAIEFIFRCDVSQIPAGHYNFGDFLLDNILNFEYQVPMFAYRLPLMM